MSAKIICAWCQSTLVFSAEPVQSVSHGICKSCKARFERERAAIFSPLVQPDNECDSFVDKMHYEELFDASNDPMGYLS